MLKWLKTLFGGPEATHAEEPVKVEVTPAPAAPVAEKPAKAPAKPKKAAAKKAAKDLSNMTKPQLLDYAKEKGVKVKSSMKKEDIVKAING
jgi:hypothetical protein